MTTTIANNWITLAEKRNGVDVQRAFGGIHPMVSEPDENGFSTVLQCPVYYWERELYPTGGVIKTMQKYYTLADLPEDIYTAEGYRRDAKAVLTGFIQALGMPGIVNPARITLEDINVLMLGAPDGYELHKDTRPKINL
jgi:hypothetical protein